jgi:hypothetical protein
MMSSSDQEFQISKVQKYALQLFYASEDIKVKVKKAKRKSIWDSFVSTRSIDSVSGIAEIVPAFYSEVEKAIKSKRNLQSAVFSECVYSQALAEKFDLPIFSTYPLGKKFEIDHFFPGEKNMQEFTMRYSYANEETKTTLIQAGGAGAVDCALVCADQNVVVRIELKEPYARFSDPNLPKYGEDGILITSDEFTNKYPQFTNMLNELLSTGFNVFEHLGNNIGNFLPKNIESAVADNYAGEKYADVICTEDSAGFLVMLPANHSSHWAKTEGEMRPTGRNSSQVWTPKKLQKTLDDKGAKDIGEFTEMDLSKFVTSNARGSKKTSRYKISPLFFLHADDILAEDGKVKFKKNLVKQNIPSISAKANFKGLDIKEVRKFYEDLLK